MGAVLWQCGSVSESQQAGGGESTPLWERRDDLLLLERLVDGVRAGAGAGVCVLGPPGIGKSTLLAAASARATEDVALWQASARELEATAPFAVVRDLLGGPVAALADEERRRLAEGPGRWALALVSEQDAGPDAIAPSDPGQMTRSLLVLAEALLAGPTLVVVDDLQWADAPSLGFLLRLLEQTTRRPLGILLAGREVAASGRGAELAALLADPRLPQVRPALLSPEAVARVLGERLGQEVSPEVVAASVEVTDGNPFLVVELARLLARDDRGALEPAAVRELVPRRVVDVVVHRLVALGAAEQALAHGVAVLGGASVRLVADVADLTTAEVERAADRLREAGLLDAGARLRFRHALLSTAVGETIAPGALAALRRRAAQVLVREPEGLHRAAGQLLHVEGIGDGEAVQTLLRAAAAALESGAPREATTLLARALAEPPSAEQRPEVQYRLGLAEMRAGDPACVGDLAAAAETLPQPAERAQAALALAMAYNFAGAYAESVKVLEAALRDLDPTADLALVVEAGLVSAALQLPDQVIRARELVAARAGLRGTTTGERLLLSHRAAIGNASSRPVAEVVTAALQAIGDGAHDLHPEAHEWTLVRLQLAAAGRYADVVESCRRWDPEVDRSGSILGKVAICFVRGFAALWSGELARAESDFGACIALVREHGGGEIAAAIATSALAEALLAQGRNAEAVALVPVEVPVSEASFNGSINLLRARGLVLLALGDAEGALRALADCRERQALIALDNPPWCAWRVPMIAAHWQRGERDQARRLLDEDLAQAEARTDPLQRGIALRWAARLGDAGADDEIATLRASVAALERTEAVLELQVSRIELGAALRRAGQRREASTWLLLGRAEADACGAAALVRQANAELAAAGSRPRRMAVNGQAALTASESRVCRLAARGLSNREIAQQLVVSPKTVEAHLSRGYRKLGVTRRDQLAAALRAGAGD
ncbi:AAA family ATPase [Nocardioides dubius]|uniref:LuxR family transcriptional regulator n=1 Tax=Nocardioides dubius TaxID=317019 RepID=A0ABN1TM42_9ACTN